MEPIYMNIRADIIDASKNWQSLRARSLSLWPTRS